MEGRPTDFSGKLEREREDGREGPVLRWHPLVDHCADVAACAEALLTYTLLGERLAHTGGLRVLDRWQIARLSVLAAWHDVGKFNHGFQRKGDEVPRETAGHVAEGVQIVASADTHDLSEKFWAELPVDILARWCNDENKVLNLLLASICHHGRPVRHESGPRPAEWNAAGQRNPLAGIAALVTATHSWFPEAFGDGGGVPLPENAGFQHAFSGLVMLADWIGSDRRWFDYTRAGDGSRIEFAREKAREALRVLGLDASHARTSLGDEPPRFETYAAREPRSPRPLQQAILDLPLPGGTDTIVLEAETGSGKTEAALAWFLRLFHAGEVDGMYFALPTRTAATQLHERVVEIIGRAFPDEDSCPPVVLAVPGYLRVDDTTGSRQLTRFDVLWNDDDQARWRYRGWAAENPKRFLSAAIAIGTIDQVLQSALRVGHAQLRATSLTRQLLVVDEVHASDAYMTETLRIVLAWHRAAGGRAMLMSATLGAEARARLLAVERSSVTTPSLERAVAFEYPAITWSRDERVIPIGGAGNPKTVHLETSRTIDEPLEVVRGALAMARAGGRVLVVRNTVKACVATQRLLEREATAPGDAKLLFSVGNVPVAHHARFTRDDRVALDRALEARFGKGAPPGGCIAIATQTVQQSLDIDADFLVTDLCPVDVLLQRLGRLQRHADRARLPAFATARACVLVPAERDVTAWIRGDGKARAPHGFGSVYADLRVIVATRTLVEERPVWNIPDDNRLLVEHATHPEVLDRIGREGGEKLRKHMHDVIGTELGAERLARLGAINRTLEFGEAAFDDAEERITTRLGEGDRLVAIDPPVSGPFGNMVHELRVPAWMAKGKMKEDSPVEVVFRDGSLQVIVGELRLRYDRLGLRDERDEAEEE